MNSLSLLLITITIMVTMTMVRVLGGRQNLRPGLTSDSTHHLKDAPSESGSSIQRWPSESGSNIQSGSQSQSNGQSSITPVRCCYKVRARTVHRGYQDIDDVGTTNTILVTIHDNEGFKLGPLSLLGGLSANQEATFKYPYDNELGTVKEVEVKTDGVDSWVPEFIYIKRGQSEFCCKASKGKLCLGSPCAVNTTHSRIIPCQDDIRKCQKRT